MWFLHILMKFGGMGSLANPPNPKHLDDSPFQDFKELGVKKVRQATQLSLLVSLPLFLSLCSDS